MTRPTEAELLAFLDGELSEPDRERVLQAIEHDRDLAGDVRAVARGMSAAQLLRQSGVAAAARGSRRRVVPVWWAAVAAAAAIAIAVPSTLYVSSRAPAVAPARALLASAVTAPEPGFVLVLHGRWPDAATVPESERLRRANEYWGWADSLAGAATLIAAGDLRWEPGVRLAPGGSPMRLAADVVESPDFVVGMFALRADSYEAAVAISRACPHLRYGGPVSVRRVARGFAISPG